MPTGLIRRAGGMYSTRRRIPVALVPHYKGKAEEVRALGTNNPTEARRLHALMWVQLDQEFDAARQTVAEAPARTPGPSPEWLAKTPEERAEYRRQAEEYEADYMEWQERDGLDAEYRRRLASQSHGRIVQ